ncbi:MAG TPA: hypothetical protein VHE60_04260 [Pyrinomonadaceae bacterium]|nr:hypothetical protein [Pyrinomonadaceae bacterium]
MRIKLSFLSLHVLLPILIGGLVYICWRDPALLMFKWFRVLGVEPRPAVTTCNNLSTPELARLVRLFFA